MDAELSQKIAAGELDAVEDAFLSRLGEAGPDGAPDAAGLAEMGRALAQSGEEERALFLLQMADDHLRQAGAWRARLRLLRQVGDLLFPDPLALHDEIVRSLVAAHGESELCRRLADKLGLQRAPEDIPKTWEKVERVEELMALAPGTIVWMEGKGAGRMAEINLQLDSFRVDLGPVGTLSVGFAAAKKMLKPLPPHHVLRRKLEDLSALLALKEAQPEELVRIALQSYEEPLTGNELRQALVGVVEDAEWTGFWNRAKKSPQVVAQGGGRQRYRWAASADAALAGVRERFAAADVRERLDLLRGHGSRDPELQRQMLAALAEQAATLRRSDPAAALEVAFALERAGSAPDGELGAASLLAAADDPVRLLAGAERGVREEGYRRLPAARPDWINWFEKALLKEEEAKLLDLVADRLAAESAGSDRSGLERAVSELLTQPRKSPGGFTWLAERAGRDETLLQRNPLRLFQQILAATADDSFGPYRKRLAKLADSGGTLPRLLPLLDTAQGAQAEEAVGKAAGLEGYQRDALKNAVHLRFPSLQREVEQPLYATPEAITAKKEELRHLLEEEIPANRKAIEEARALGDLRENFEYKSARQRHEYLAARASGLHRDLGRARPIIAGQVDPSAVRIGTRLMLRGPAGEERAITLLGPWDSQPEQGILSHESELATSLLGKQVGDSVQLEGKAFRIERIQPFR
ncbi:MAG TPA: GreA/GreB family elongation factor [Thermoanaerobaculia bacterium]|jgi:transcription elongation GreA/GreB family factor|nr:GreA/GreB family elongation factor [Thermoanaerobaculia bacterium]